MLDLKNGDCIELMKELPDKSVDCIITDPPYFIPATHYETRRLFKRNFADLGIMEGFFKQVWEEVDRVLKDDGLLYVFCDGQSYPLFYYYTFFITKTVRPLIWDKKTAFNGYYWRHQHELILFGVRGEKHKIPTGNGDILRFNAVKADERLHPAQKPLDLIEYIILNTSKQGDTILDPFMGIGTVPIACKKLSRNGIGIELSADYYKIAKQMVDRMDVEIDIPDFEYSPTAQEKVEDYIKQRKLGQLPMIESFNDEC